VDAGAEEAEEQDGDGEQEESADLAAAFDLPVCRVGWAVRSWALEWKWEWDSGQP
jgi:hypothetical protein